MDYRLVILGSGGEPAHIEEWACTSDVEAAERASRHRTPYGAELWGGERRIGAYAGALAPAEPG